MLHSGFNAFGILRAMKVYEDKKFYLSRRTTIIDIKLPMYIVCYFMICVSQEPCRAVKQHQLLIR